VRLVCGVVASLTPLYLNSWRGLGAAVAVAVGLAAIARIPARAWGGRLLAVNGFVLMLALVVPWSIPGDALIIAGGWEYTREGAAWAGRAALRANAVLILLTALLGTMEPTVTGHAMQRLRVPDRLALLLMFTVRYIGVFEQEYLRLRQAMRVRGFRPSLDAHTLRSYGYLTGMLLVHAFERSERIQQAMVCRGFTGKFHTHRHMRVRASDWVFVGGLAIALAGVALTERVL
jgi:cobalt/nickel transport system permease protein